MDILKECGIFEDSPVSFIMDTEFIPPNNKTSSCSNEMKTKASLKNPFGIEPSSKSDTGFFKNSSLKNKEPKRPGYLDLFDY